ncbi:hypothetical protein ACFVUS_09700 [Nocardia sp. NPDC058058]|uniref:hypothetical protein n=1 Tax=Nocardia sp. NPDC058058 TaxID=3346317 RepID=UPI0036DE37AE
MSTPLARNRIRVIVAALAIGATVTTAATAQAAPVAPGAPSIESPVAAPNTGSSAFGIDWDSGMITASAAAPFAITAVIACLIGMNTGSVKSTPGNDNPCLPI